jgi:hypothetical protein
MDERLIPLHTMLFYPFETDNKLPMIDSNPGLRSFNNLQHSWLGSLVFCSLVILGCISLSSGRSIQLHHFELHPYGHHQGRK